MLNQNTLYEVMWNIILVSVAIIIPVYISCHILHRVYIVNKAIETADGFKFSGYCSPILLLCFNVCTSYPKEQYGHLVSTTSIYTPFIIIVILTVDGIKNYSKKRQNDREVINI